MMDLFGNERIVTHSAKPVALNLFDAAAESKAMVSGRPVSQERTELEHGRICACGTQYTSAGPVCRACAVRAARGH